MSGLGVWPLFLVGILARLSRRPWGVSPRPAWEDFLISILCGLVYALAGGMWFARFGLQGPGLLAGALAPICPSFLGETPLSWIGRLLSPLLPWLGLQSTLLWGAAFSHLLLGATWYGVARIFHSRQAGIFAVILGLGLSPLVLLSRTPNLDPETVAALAGIGALLAGTDRLGFLGGLAPFLDPLGWVWTLLSVLVHRKNPRFWVGIFLVFGGGLALGGHLPRPPLPTAVPWGTAALSLYACRDRRSRERLALPALLLSAMAPGQPVGLLELPLLGGLVLSTPLSPESILEPFRRSVDRVPVWLRQGLPAAVLLAWMGGLLPASGPSTWTRVPAVASLETDVDGACRLRLQEDSLAGRGHVPYGPALPTEPLRFASDAQVLQAALSSFDTNHDGVISSGEYWNFGDPEAFSATDANADGRIDATEWQAWISDTQPRPQDHPFWNAKTYLLSRPSTLSAPVPVPPTLPPVPPPSVALVPPSPPPQKSLLWKGLLGSVFVALLGLVGIWGRERRRRRRRSRS